MIKISPININLTKLNKIKNVKTCNFVKAPYSLGCAAVGMCGAVISTFIQDYERTERENYFQLKTDSKTGDFFKPDIFQRAAGMNIYLGNDVLVTAPTGTGKTAIAEYAITNNLKKGKRTFYTTPLKALSNEKFLDFSKTYGNENVGLITGDTKINTEAPIIIMTTEVYRNMATTDKFDCFSESKRGIPENVNTVIFDELQYLGDVDRGGIWEQSIILTPPNVQMISLSATIGNNDEINNWIASTKGRKGSSVTPKMEYLANTQSKSVLINVPSEMRHVPLTHNIERVAADIKIPRGCSKSEKIRAKKEGARVAQSIYAKPKDEAFKSMTKKLNEEGKLPAIYFVFSKKDCRHLLKYLSIESELLTNEDERAEIAKTINEYINNGIYLGESLNTDALMKGYAIHNAGLLPSQKRLVEELFQRKLIKVVLATETLSAGINMPAKTTVISSPRKPSSISDGGNDKKRNLTPNEYHQMAGRAGRRGIDTEGYCYAMACNQEQSKIFESLINSPSNELNSNLDLDFSFICNYFSDFNNENELRYILSKSLYAYKSSAKIEELLENFDVKKDILVTEGFIDSDGKVSDKGYLLKNLNGYEQIPIINLLFDKSLADADEKQIAGVIGGLANIEYNTKDNQPTKPFELKRQDAEKLVKLSQFAHNEVLRYGNVIRTLFPQREITLNSKAVDHLYTWAELNENTQDSRKNWKELYNLKLSIKDEGSLFKEITTTADLLKQLIEIADIASKSIKEDEDYYSTLSKKFAKALQLIQREPVNNNEV